MTRGLAAGREGGGADAHAARTGARASCRRSRAVAIAALALLALAACASVAFARGASPPSLSPAQLAAGEKLYRSYCGQCHALAVALSAGFGSGKGLGTNGGPSFNNLRVPFGLCVISLTETFAGHEVIFNTLSWNQVQQVSRYVASVTAHHPVLARPIYD